MDREGRRVPVTASFGVAELCAAELLEQLVDRADGAMYAAKGKGRNCVCLASEVRGRLAGPSLSAAQTEKPPSPAAA
jgi:predicted signal transduction protein with EAL and GGDEF domain